MENLIIWANYNKKKIINVFGDLIYKGAKDAPRLHKWIATFMFYKCKGKNCDFCPWIIYS